MIRYMLTIFLSAFLLFQVQPIIGRFVLPWFGGSASVWNTCMLFFQIALLAGYCYSHLVTRFLNSRQQWILHSVLLGVSLFFLPVQPGEWLKPNGDENITFAILSLLAISIGLPFMMLSTTGPLLQAWQSRTHASFSTYRLFALSNTGSLIALLSYPFLFEPFLTRGTQSTIWTIAYVLFGVLCVWSGWQVFRYKDSESPEEREESSKADEDSLRPGIGKCGLWCLLAAAASAMLLATTNQMCQEVASVPFLWILPLSLYLITFIICFDSPRWYLRKLFLVLLLTSPFLGVYLLIAGVTVPLPFQVLGYCLVMFSCCMSCHGELSRLKPSTRYLTLFYLMISIGGALGGSFIVLVAPNIFVSYYEFDILLILCTVLGVGVFMFSDPEGKIPVFAWVSLPILFAGCFLVGLHLNWDFTNSEDERVVHMSRNSYGTVRVEERIDLDTGKAKRRILYNGRIKHGSQNLQGEVSPVSYYSPATGVGRAIVQLRAQVKRPLKIGVVGLGTGTIAAWGEDKDEIVFYEINPQVIEVAESRFDYFKIARSRGASVEVVLGDARVKLEQQLVEGSQKFDILAIDAFSSDAIPIHLLTKECFQVYLDHLKPGGVLAIHISNRFLNLEPICYNLANDAKCFSQHVGNHDDDNLEPDDKYYGTDGANWILVSHEKSVLDAVVEMVRDERKNGNEISQVYTWEELKKEWSNSSMDLVWTDDFANLASIIDWDVNDFLDKQVDKARRWFGIRRK